MDGITEPVVLILGHPIAGNPAQFALERAFASLDLQWRVLSCDVPPDRVDVAIEGANVLGFRGLLLDRNLIRDVNESGVRRDLYSRRQDSIGGWQSENALETWLESEIRRHFESAGTDVGPSLLIGSPDPSFPTKLSTDETHSPIAWASTESIQRANLIAISETLDFSEWPSCDGDTLVVDFANPPNDLEPIRTLGYRVIGREEARIGILTACFQRWTGQLPAVDVLAEAIEEYLAV
jgi:hypothetical protein